MPDLKTVAKVGGKAVKAAGDVLPKLALLGKTLAVISGTMTALTVAGWAITRANEKRDRKSTRLNSSHNNQSRMPSSA